ncbi:MAG TPA: hypothetical protein VFH29_04860 [Anaerolineales bacterium]|nr:hypothetical protein [Anaerolineales bacterium]
MKTMKILMMGSSSLMLVALAACSALQPAGVAQPAPSAQSQPGTGVQYHFVTNKLLLPSTQDQADSFALNIDGDSAGTGDNLFGRLLILVTKAAPGLETQSTVDAALASGKIVSLHVVKADDPLNDTSVSWSIVQGQETQTAPTFNGTDKFTVEPGAPVNAPIVGTLKAGHFSGGPGSGQVRIYLFNQPVDVNLIGLRLEADVTAQGCTNGKLGGGLTVAEFRSKLLPSIAEGLTQVVAANPTASKLILTAFDSNGDSKISVDELEKSPALMLAASPDMDLLDSYGKFNPGQDGKKDTYSIGLGFTCVPAVFTAAGE